MKYNLKNRPKLFDPKFASKTDDWFKGFKKELREKLTQPEYSDEYKMFSAEDVIKEILGE